MPICDWLLILMNDCDWSMLSVSVKMITSVGVSARVSVRMRVWVSVRISARVSVRASV